MQIRHLTHHEIDITKWDEAIALSFNHLFYAFSWYLDAVSPDWEALISGDYEYLMPLPVKRKFKIPYLVQPIMTQQLGLFSKLPISKEILTKFIEKIPYPSYELNLNAQNEIPKIDSKPNYLLSLECGYMDLKRNFTSNTLRNIEKAKKQKLQIKEDLLPEEFLNFYWGVEKNYSNINEDTLVKLINKGHENKMLKIFGAYNTEDILIAGLCLIISKQRITYLLPASNAEGKSKSAMFGIVDQIIQKYSSKNYILDFEGSQIDGIARFYKGFGAANHPYYVIRRWRPSFLVGRI